MCELQGLRPFANGHALTHHTLAWLDARSPSLAAGHAAFHVLHGAGPQVAFAARRAEIEVREQFCRRLSRL